MKVQQERKIVGGVLYREVFWSDLIFSYIYAHRIRHNGRSASI